MSKGQPVMQYPQPMQLSCWKSTMPLAYCTTAPGAGQALRQPGSVQCMHPSLKMNQASEPSISVSLNFITVQDWSVRFMGLV